MSDSLPTNSRDRQARIAEIRRQIAEGTYETPAKIEAAVEKLLVRLEGEDQE
jgi:hypothetical protein